MRHWAGCFVPHSILILCLGLSACIGCRSSKSDPVVEGVTDGNTAAQKEDDLSRYDPLYRASQRLQADASLGVSRTTLHQDLLQFATEVAVLKNAQRTDREKEMYDRYASAIQIYSDTLTLWTHATGWEGRISVEGEIARIQKAYHLPLTSDSREAVASGSWNSPAMEKSVVPKMLTIAQKQLESADNLLTAARNN